MLACGLRVRGAAQLAGAGFPAVAQLSDAEAAALGAWQVRLSRALQEATGCRKTYVACHAEREGFRRVHFHIVPRADGLPASLHGPGIFERLKPEDAPADSGYIDQIATTLHELLWRRRRHHRP